VRQSRQAFPAGWQAFPAGLYGMLLFALCCLTLPSFFVPIERFAVGTVCLVPRAIAAWSGEPAAAAEPEMLQRLAELRADLEKRIEQHDIAGASAVMPAHWAPVACTVVAAGDRGGGGQPSELRLDRTYEELAGCSEFVTKGPALLGFLQRPGIGFAARGRWSPRRRCPRAARCAW